MEPEAGQILKQALALSAESRAFIVDSLLDSLDLGMDEGADHLWQEEIRARIADLDSGSVQPVSWADVRERLRYHIK
jgi:putative addiction module component (TIGR02574 family)